MAITKKTMVISEDTYSMGKSARILIWAPYLLAKYTTYAKNFLKDDVYAVFLRGSLAGERGKLYGLVERGLAIKHPDIDLVFVIENNRDRQDLMEYIITNEPKIPQEVFDIEPSFEYEVHEGNLYKLDWVFSKAKCIRKLENKKEELTGDEIKLLKANRDIPQISRAINRGVILYQRPSAIDDYINYKRETTGLPIYLEEYIKGVWLKTAEEIKKEGKYDKDFKKAHKALVACSIKDELMKNILEIFELSDLA